MRSTRHIKIIRSTTADLVALSEKAQFLDQLTYSQVEPSGATDIDSIVTTVCDDIEHDYPSVTISRAISSEVDTAVNGWFEVALENLLENAIIHNDADDPRVSIAVSPASAGSVEIKVSDNGPEIPPEEIKPLKSDTETPLIHGSGLGLWLVKWVVETLDGELAFDESAAAGTGVVVTLP